MLKVIVCSKNNKDDAEREREISFVKLYRHFVQFWTILVGRRIALDDEKKLKTTTCAKYFNYNYYFERSLLHMPSTLLRE